MSPDQNDVQIQHLPPQRDGAAINADWQFAKDHFIRTLS